MEKFFNICSVEDEYRVFQSSDNEVQLGWLDRKEDPVQMWTVEGPYKLFGLRCKGNPFGVLGAVDTVPDSPIVIPGRFTKLHLVGDSDRAQIRSEDRPDLYLTALRSEAYSRLVLWPLDSQAGMQTWRLADIGKVAPRDYDVVALFVESDGFIGWQNGRFTMRKGARWENEPAFHFRRFDWKGGRAFQNVVTGKYIGYEANGAPIKQFDRVCNEALWSVDPIYDGAAWNLIRPALNQDVCLDINGPADESIDNSSVSTSTWMHRYAQTWALNIVRRPHGGA